MNRNYEKQAELFNERLNETASLASKRPQKKQKLTRLNSLTGRARGSLSSRRSVAGMTGRAYYLERPRVVEHRPVGYLFR